MGLASCAFLIHQAAAKAKPPLVVQVLALVPSAGFNLPQLKIDNK